jgi:hypothetical protein
VNGNHSEPPSRSATVHRIIEAVVTGITGERSAPYVFLLDEDGRPTAWPAGPREAMPPELARVLQAYFAKSAQLRGIFTELVQIGGMRMSVRIIPYHAAGANRYALTVERFATRASASSA